MPFRRIQFSCVKSRLDGRELILVSTRYPTSLRREKMTTLMNFLAEISGAKLMIILITSVTVLSMCIALIS